MGASEGWTSDNPGTDPLVLALELDAPEASADFFEDTLPESLLLSDPADLPVDIGAPLTPSIRGEFEKATAYRPRRFFVFPQAPRRASRTSLAMAPILAPLPAPDPRQALTRQTQGGNLNLGYSQNWMAGQLQVNALLEPSSDSNRTRYSRPLDRRELIGRDSVRLGSMLAYRQNLDENLDIDLKASLKREVNEETIREDSGRIWLFNEGSSAVTGDMAGRANWRAARGISFSLDGSMSSSERYSQSFITADDQVMTPNSPVRLVSEARSNLGLNSQLEPFNKISVNSSVALINQSMSQTIHEGGYAQLAGRNMTYLRPEVRVRWQALQRLELSAGVKDEMASIGYGDMMQPELAAQVQVRPTHYVFSAARISYPVTFDTADMRGEVSLSTEAARATNAVDHTALIQDGGFIGIRSNVGEAHTRDINARFNLNSARPGPGATQIELSATWRQSSINDPFQLMDRPLSGQSPFSLNLSFKQTLENLNWGLRADNGWRSTTWLVNEISSSRATPQVDLFAEFLPLEGLKLRAELNNITRRSISYQRQAFDGIRSVESKSTRSEWSQDQEPSVIVRLVRPM